MPRTDKKEMETDPFLLCWCKKIAGRPSGPALPGAIWEWVQRIHPFSFSCYIFGAINFSEYSNSRRAMSLQPHIQRLQRAHESPGDLVKTADSDSGALGWAWDSACLSSSQVIPIHLVWGEAALAAIYFRLPPKIPCTGLSYIFRHVHMKSK